MATTMNKKTRTRRPASAERTVIYRGIKIAPMTGRRSPLAQAIRDGLRTRKAEQPRGEPAQA